MIEGFWIVQFQGIQGNGGGVALFVKGRILGGDGAYLYEGTYELRQNLVKARARIRNFLPGVPNVLGVTGDFDLLIEGTLERNIITGTATPAKGSPAGIVVKLTKHADLP